MKKKNVAHPLPVAHQSLLQDFPVRVCGFMGSQSPAGGLRMADVAVCTIEKANSLVNRLLESGDEGWGGGMMRNAKVEEREKKG